MSNNDWTKSLYITEKAKENLLAQNDNAYIENVYLHSLKLYYFQTPKLVPQRTQYKIEYICAMFFSLLRKQQSSNTIP